MANFRDLIKRSQEKYPDNTAFIIKTGIKKYKYVSYSEFYDEIRALGTAMIESKMAGSRIGIIGDNCYEWMLAHAAIQFTSSISVPLDKGLKLDELVSSIERAELGYLFYGKDQAKKIAEMTEKNLCSNVIAIPLYDDEDPGINALLSDGFECMSSGNFKIDDVEIDDYAMSLMIFTSGTTSQSKIVMLSQNNIVSNACSILNLEAVYETDTNLSLLPYHHVLGSIAQWVLLASGARTAYCDGLKHIQKNMNEYGITIFVGVPLIVESMYKKIMRQAEKNGIAGRVKGFSKIARGLNKLHIDVRRKMFKSILEAFGGKLRMCIIGGAAGDAECIKGFSDFGIITLQGYGLTETSPILTLEKPGYTNPGSVGTPIDGVEVAIFEPDEKGIGEIIARGENIMLGYYGNQAATDEVIVDGWFHTGDLGYFDKKGFLFITGRKKNVIVLKNGKNVFPEELEQLIAPLPYVQEAIVLGVPEPDDERDLVLTLKLVYNKEVFPDMSAEEIHAKIKSDIEEINDKTPTYKRIKRIIATDEEMVKTTTGKVKRHVELQKILDERAEMTAENS